MTVTRPRHDRDAICDGTVAYTVIMMKTQRPTPMLAAERRAVAALAGIFALRMFGLFALLPVLAVYALTLPGGTPTLAGLALGAYGLTQALFQIPFGLAADRWARKSVITVGLILFAVGSIIAAEATTIVGLILGRAVQGAGAISAAILALAADLTRISQRTKAMACLGISIGATFMLALLLAPSLQQWLGVDGLLWGLAWLVVPAVVVVWRGLAAPECPERSDQISSSGPLRATAIMHAFRHPQLWQLNFGIFVSHLILTALFVVVPLQFIAHDYPLAQHWQLYLPILMLSVIGMTPFVRLGGRAARVAVSLRRAVGLILLAQLLLFASEVATLPWLAWYSLLLGLVVFFSAFNGLESLLPSLVSQLAGARTRATHFAVYNTYQFSGVFCGGLGGGWLYGLADARGVFLCGAILAGLWWLVSLGGSRFTLTRPQLFPIGDLTDSQKNRLLATIARLNGVVEASIVANGVNRLANAPEAGEASVEKLLYVEVDPAIYDHAEIVHALKTKGG